jgi:D-hydroxyproline dehydrogenase subunit beta
MPAFDAIVIGAGIVGTACAWRLSADGLRVLVLDPREPGSVATAAGMGHVVLIDDSEARFALTRYGRDLWARLGPTLPVEAAYRTPGTLWLAQTEAEMRALGDKAAALQERDIGCHVLGERELSDAEPRLRRGLAGALLVPDDAIVNAPAAARWLLERAREAGAEFRRDSVVAVESRQLLLHSGEPLAAPMVVLAAGTASAGLFAGLPIRPRKGHLILTGPTDGFCRHELIELAYLSSAHGSGQESIAFNVQPRADGRVLIGASRQYGATDEAVEGRIVELLAARAAAFLPGIEAAARERTWTGFRAATPDALPLIGPHPQVEGLLIATGHEGLGITTALATGQIIADLVADRAPEIPVLPFAPDRAARWDC